MSDRKISINELEITEQEIVLLVHALMKASAYENEHWASIAERAAKKYDSDTTKEQCVSFTNNSRYYEREYTALIKKLCRGRAKKQGGIYRKATMDLMKSAAEGIRKDTEDSIAALRHYTYMLDVMEDMRQQAEPIGGRYIQANDRRAVIHALAIPEGTMAYKSCRIKLMTDALSLLKAHGEVIDALLKVGYPHNFQREPRWIVNYMYAITDVIKKAVNLRNEVSTIPEEKV